jgi:hypothetical protein
MNTKKILIGLVACMFLSSILPGIIGEQDADEYTFKERRVIDHREIKAVYTEHGLEKVPGARGKPGVTVDITNPADGDTVSGTVTITVDATYTPTISIDGTAVITDTTYIWYTNQYADGTHTIKATTRGVTDTHTVTVSNGGGGNTAPTVTITSPNNGATVSGSVTISVDATDPEDGALTADIYIDGEKKTTGNSYTWDTTAYSDGTHTIYATATDSGDLSDNDEITVTVNNGGGGEGNKYALVIGISDYEGTSSDLQYCDDDAQDWKNFLQGEGYTVTMLTDHQATADNIIAAIDNLLADEYADDYVVLAYSGHGTEISGYGSCIVTHDLYGIDHGYFESCFATADSQHIFFSFDACVIGDFQGLVTNNRVGAFASNSRYSYDGDASMQNGVFTYYQMEGWDTYNNFEEDSAYAVQEMKDWPPSPRIKVDPFYVDQFAGTMYP